MDLTQNKNQCICTNSFHKHNEEEEFIFYQHKKYALSPKKKEFRIHHISFY